MASVTEISVAREHRLEAPLPQGMDIRDLMGASIFRLPVRLLFA